MTTTRGKRYPATKLFSLCVLSFIAAVMLGLATPDSVFAATLRAPTQVPGYDVPYYYVSDSIGENGKFPITWVGFYWGSNSGTKTITYNPRMCNNGGYDDTSDGDPRITIYRIKADGTPDQTASGTIVSATGINKCHNSSKSTPFPFDLSGVALDSKINMYGVAVRVDSRGTGSSRAWFSLETSDAGADFGVLGNKSVGYSRDITGSAGGYYNLQTGFGSCDAGGGNGMVSFFDTDRSKYQNTKWDNNALQIQFLNRGTGQAIKNNAPGVFGISPGIDKRPGNSYLFNITAGTAENASIEFNMQQNAGYQLDINHLREGNDITVEVPTNEIYSKKLCRGDWTMRGRTTVSTSTASPGDKVKFTHYVKNEGPMADDVADIWADTSIRRSPGSPVAAGMQAFGGQNFSVFAAGQEKTVFTNNITIPSSASAGQQYCENVGFAPYSSTAPSSANRATGPEVCVTVQYSYELTPHVDVSALMVRAGSDVTFKPNVTDTNAYPTKDTTWSVRQVIIPPALSVPYTGVRTNGNFDCPYYTSKKMGCTDVESGNKVFASVSPTYLANINGYTYNVASNVPSGTKICYALAINSRDNTPNQKAEALTCVIVTRSPLLQVWGNDVRVGSALLALNNNPDSHIKTNTGSWGEYGVLAPGSITTFGSASNKASALLTFANTPPGALGHYLGVGATQASGLGSLPDIGRYLAEAGNAANKVATRITLDSAGGNTVASYQANTVVRRSGTVTITKDIKNTSAGSTLTQMVIIADNIDIDPGVKQVDAWLIALGSDGTINTCTGNQTLTIDLCNEQLHINGPIVASSLVLRRTFDGDGTQPAEILNLRGDAYIWMRHISEAMGSIHTTFLRELPPRY